MPASSNVDLAKLFNAVTLALKESKESLNEADDYNHNHGDNMVNNFQLITKALKEKKSEDVSEQLAYASQSLSQRSESGSAQLYSQGLSQAAEQLRGQPGITADNAMSLVQALMGAGSTASAPQAAPNDMMGLLGSLLGGGAQASAPAQSSTAQGGDLLGGLMGALLGGGASPSQPETGGQAAGGINLNTLLTAGMAYMQSTQKGASPVEALVQAVLAGSQMSNSAHHSQSGQIVASTLIQTLGSFLGGKKR